MNDAVQRFHNTLAAALVLGFVPKDKGKKSKTKCQQKKPVSMRQRAKEHLGLKPGDSLRQVSRFKFILSGNNVSTLLDLKHNTYAVIEKDSKIGRKYAIA